MSAAAPQPIATYVQPCAPAVYAPQVYAAPHIASSYGGEPAAYVASMKHQQFAGRQVVQPPQYVQPSKVYRTLQPAASMVAYPGLPMGYMPTSVQAAWDNHFEAFGKQDLVKIMLDYDETSVARVYNFTDGSSTTFTGTAQIRQMFAGLFAELIDLSTLEAPVVQVDESPKMVFLCWKCPGSGFATATDTFLFGDDLKIKRQNIVVTKAAPTASAPAAAAAAGAADASEAAATSKGASSKKKTTKKTSTRSQKNGFC